MQIELTEVQADIVKYALINESSRLDACIPDLFTHYVSDSRVVELNNHRDCLQDLVMEFLLIIEK